MKTCGRWIAGAVMTGACAVASAHSNVEDWQEGAGRVAECFQEMAQHDHRSALTAHALRVLRGPGDGMYHGRAICTYKQDLMIRRETHFQACGDQGLAYHVRSLSMKRYEARMKGIWEAEVRPVGRAGLWNRAGKNVPSPGSKEFRVACYKWLQWAEYHGQIPHGTAKAYDDALMKRGL